MRCITHEEMKVIVEATKTWDPKDSQCIDDDPRILTIHDSLEERGLLVTEVVEWRNEAEVYRVTELGRVALTCYYASHA